MSDAGSHPEEGSQAEEAKDHDLPEELRDLENSVAFHVLQQLFDEGEISEQE
jgi:hypothetical protein